MRAIWTKKGVIVDVTGATNDGAPILRQLQEECPDIEIDVHFGTCHAKARLGDLDLKHASLNDVNSTVIPITRPTTEQMEMAFFSQDADAQQTG